MMKQKANEADQEQDLKEAFQIFDRDKDGYIDLKELKTVATMLGSMLNSCLGQGVVLYSAAWRRSRPWPPARQAAKAWSRCGGW